MDKETKYIIGLLLAFITLMVITIYVYYSRQDNEVKEQTCIVKLEQPEFLLKGSPDIASLELALKYYEIEYPHIVLTQAILETGYFRSTLCKSHNNLFGLYNCREDKYYKFEHWSESIVFYKKHIQSRYCSSEDYYEFLERIGYSEDPEYVKKLKEVMSYNKTK